MRITTFLATLMLTSLVTLSAQNPTTQGTTQGQQSAASANADTLSGCLKKGSQDQYYLVEQNGDHHILMARQDQDLSSYVNHEVTLTGKTAREAGTTNDVEGHRSGFFSVESVKDQGNCKKE